MMPFIALPVFGTIAPMKVWVFGPSSAPVRGSLACRLAVVHGFTLFGQPAP
jgi:hypothetical protein